MTDSEIVKALEILDRLDFFGGQRAGRELWSEKPFDIQNKDIENFSKDIAFLKGLINRLQAENERLKEENESYTELEQGCYVTGYKKIKSEAYKEFAEKVDEILKRYAHLHKNADKARHSTEEYADGTPMEMVSVWEVLSLKKWEMCDYETMNTLEDNIETIAKERLLTELEKDLRLLKKELVGRDNASKN